MVVWCSYVRWLACAAFWVGRGLAERGRAGGEVGKMNGKINDKDFSPALVGCGALIAVVVVVWPGVL